MRDLEFRIEVIKVLKELSSGEWSPEKERAAYMVRDLEAALEEDIKHSELGG